MQSRTATTLSPSELESIHLGLKHQFQQNMLAFQQFFPEIFQYFANYKPKQFQITLNQSGQINLSDTKNNNQAIYLQNPELIAAQQVEQFLQKSYVASVNFNTSPVLNQKHIFPRISNALIEETRAAIQNSEMHCKIPIGLILVAGCGLGLHVPLLIKKLNIQNMIIFEPNTDAFYASLFATDWVGVLKHFVKNNRLLQFNIGTSADTTVRNMRLLKDHIGLHNMVYTFVFQHLKNSATDALIKQSAREYHLNFFGAGFFDDEQVGLAHTIANINNKVKVFQANPNDRKELPVFIVGNGPSLDDHIEFLQRHCDKAIILSCGTALGSLQKINVKPDFHVEMERNINIRDWIQQGSSEEFRQGVALLCLNTIAPEITGLFSETCIAKKSNDIGAHLIDQFTPGATLDTLDPCNPTVTNAGLAFALQLGFKQIYLIGVDLGLRPDGKHHSKFSLYQDLEEKTKSKGHSLLENTTDNYFVPGNFGGDVSTNAILDTSRQNMEISLINARSTHDDIQCFNSNSGVRIQGTQPIKVNDIQLSTSAIHKQAVIESIKSTHFIELSGNSIPVDKIKSQQLKTFFSLKSSIILKKNIDSPAAIMAELDIIFQRIVKLKDKDPISYYLLKGSINVFFSIIAKACLFQSDRKTTRGTFNLCRRHYMEFIKEVYHFMEQHPLELDDTFDNTVVKLTGGTANSE